VNVPAGQACRVDEREDRRHDDRQRGTELFIEKPASMQLGIELRGIP
jgi:hypothetical protein